MVISRFREEVRNGCADPRGYCFKDSPSAPPPPDLIGSANAQGVANKEAAVATGQIGNPNVTNPYGQQTISYQNDPLTGNPVPYVNQTLSPSGQSLFDQSQRINLALGNTAERGLGFVQNTLNQPFNFGALPKSPVNPGQSYTEAAMSRLQPQIDNQRDQLRTQLANQGINLSSNDRAYSNAFRDQNTRENDMLAAVVGSSIGQDQSYRQQALQEQEFGRTEPLNILNAVRSSAPVNIPQFQGVSGANVNPAPILQGALAQNQANQGFYNQQAANTNAANQGLFSLGGSALSALAFSDRRLKRDVRVIGSHPVGVPLYSFRYLWSDEPQIGVMADEVFHVKPEAVSTREGFLVVDYGRL